MHVPPFGADDPPDARLEAFERALVPLLHDALRVDGAASAALLDTVRAYGTALRLREVPPEQVLIRFKRCFARVSGHYATTAQPAMMAESRARFPGQATYEQMLVRLIRAYFDGT